MSLAQAAWWANAPAAVPNSRLRAAINVFRNGTLGYNPNDRVILGAKAMMAAGTVKSFNRLKGYGFIRTESGKDIFVHLSAVQQAGLANLRKGQKISFEIFENQGKAAAKNLRSNRKMESASERKLVSSQSSVTENVHCKMSPKKGEEQLNGKRTSITRTALELTMAELVRNTSPECSPLVGIIVERVVPESPDGANWAVKGVKYGKADRDRCSAALFKCVEEGQRDFEVSD
jgi:cold shock CspA family protein